MATRLRNLRIKRVALVDEGANPEAHIRFAKSKEGEPPEEEAGEMTADEAQSLLKRFFSAVAKAFGGDVEKKDGKTFAEMESKRDYDALMQREVWPMIYAMSDSARSILFDDDRDDGAKAALLKQSVKEFAEAFSEAADAWAKGKETGSVSKSAEALVEMRDQLNAVIAKAIAKAEEMPDDSGDNKEPKETGGTTEEKAKSATDDKCVQKGANNMIFDIEKMTPEERAQYDDLAKRYGHEDAPEENKGTEAPQADPAEEPTGGDDMYKGLHPAVKAELETLRKFREESELRQYTEIAKKYALLGKKPEELAPVLKSLKDAGGTAYDSMIALLDSNLAAVESSGAFSEIGKRGVGDSTENAWGKIEAAAQEIQKAKPDMRWCDAVDAACNAHPDLVEAYEKSRR